MSNLKKPIFITGSHRSGTTWVADCLSYSNEVRLIYEPFNPTLNPALKLPYWFYQIATIHEEREFTEKLKWEFRVNFDITSFFQSWHNSGKMSYGFGELMYWIKKINGGVRPLIKDPIALFSAESIYKLFDPEMIVLIRHPAAFVYSLKRMSWYFDFRNFISQESLRNTIQPFQEEIDNVEEKDIVKQGILLWNIIHSRILEYKVNNQSWHFIRHEDISFNPEEYFQKLYELTGLNFNMKVRNKLRLFSTISSEANNETYEIHRLKRNSKENICMWKENLTNSEIERIYEGCNFISSNFYNDSEW